MRLQDVRLYYGDSYLTEFHSVVAEVKEREDGQWVRLRESAFYPTSGGQPFDTGEIAADEGRQSYPVTQVEVEDGNVWHRIGGVAESDGRGDRSGQDGEANSTSDGSIGLEVGQAVSGKIDWHRRFDFMQQHHGQHILSACFEQAMGANTSSFHMGDTYSSIDLDISSLSDEEVQSVLLEANRWIWRDVPVRSRFVTEDELALMHLRKAPSVTEDIRIVTIEGLEDNACGGTHPSSTGQVGQILITKTERMRGGVRVTFVCGERALLLAKETVDMVRTMASGLSVGNGELMDAVGGLQNQLKESKRAYDVLRSRYASLLARDFVTRETKNVGGTLVLFAVLPELDEVPELKRMAISSAELLTEVYGGEPQLIVFAGELGGRTHLVAQATDGAVAGADTVVKEVLPVLDGKGGGNFKAAQGSAPAPVDRVVALVEAFINIRG